MAVTTKATELGMHTEQLAGRSQQRFFHAEEQERFTYPQSFEVDFKKRTQFDAASMSTREINLELRELMSQGYGIHRHQESRCQAFAGSRHPQPAQL